MEHSTTTGLKCFTCGKVYDYKVDCLMYASLPKCCLESFKSFDHLHLTDFEDVMDDVGVLHYVKNKYDGWDIVLTIDAFRDDVKCLCDADALLRKFYNKEKI